MKLFKNRPAALATFMLSLAFAAVAASCSLTGQIPGSSESLTETEKLAKTLLASSDFVTNPASISSTTLSAFLLVKSSARGAVLNVSPSNPTTQAFDLSFDASNVTSTYYTSASDASETSLARPSSPWVVVGLSFTEDPTSMDLTVNGTLASVPTQTGSPTSPLSLARYPSVSSANVKDVLLFTRALSREEQSAMLLYLAKKNGLSITLDPLLKVPVNTSSDPNFAPAQNLIQAKCHSCHSAWSGVSANYYFSTGLAVKGQAESSSIYYRLTGSSGANGPKTMPTSGSISASEADLIKTWINNAP